MTRQTHVTCADGLDAEVHGDEWRWTCRIQHQGRTPEVPHVGYAGGDDGVADAGYGVVVDVAGLRGEETAVVTVGHALYNQYVIPETKKQTNKANTSFAR